MINTNKTVNIRCVVILVQWYSWYFKKSGKIMYKFRYLQFNFVYLLEKNKKCGVGLGHSPEDITLKIGYTDF